MSRDLPMLFSAPMVKALLAGRKTQTRRIANFIEPEGDFWRIDTPHGGMSCCDERLVKFYGPSYSRYEAGWRIWVKETWQTLQGFDHLKPTLLKKDAPIGYFADSELTTGGKTRVSIHMPRWASRLTLLVTDVRVERLHDISEEDCLAEGAPLSPYHYDTTQDGSNPYMCEVEDRPHVTQSPRAWYHRLWDDINGPDSWDANPWVVAVSFQTEKRNIDQ